MLPHRLNAGLRFGTTATTVNVGIANVTANREFIVQFVDLGAGIYGVTVVGTGAGASLNGASFAAYTDSGYNSLELAHAAGTAFLITGFGTTAVTPGLPVDFVVPVQHTDGDGDTQPRR